MPGPGKRGLHQGNAYINMAETLRFIIREYTTPSDLPIIYITDSKNARRLQRKLKKSDELTHRKKIRQVKQDIDYSIANHLEMLISKWQCKDQLTAYAKRLYKRGGEICYTWAMSKEHFSDDTEDNQNSQYGDFRREEDASDISIKSGTTITSVTEPNDGKNRYIFNTLMYDILGRIIILKVFSHQMNKDFSIKNKGKIPCPNLFVISANQIVDNSAKQAPKVLQDTHDTYEQIFYPAFSPRWSFTFEGCITNKGATKILYNKMDDELPLTTKPLTKQGIFS